MEGSLRNTYCWRHDALRVAMMYVYIVRTFRWSSVCKQAAIWGRLCKRTGGFIVSPVEGRLWVFLVHRWHCYMKGLSCGLYLELNHLLLPSRFAEKRKRGNSSYLCTSKWCFAVGQKESCQRKDGMRQHKILDNCRILKNKKLAGVLCGHVPSCFVLFFTLTKELWIITDFV